MKKTSFFIVLFCSILGFSQEKKSNLNNVQIDGFYGWAIEHDKKLENAIDGNPFGILVQFNYYNSKNTEFNKLYNNPNRGFSFIYEDFNSDVLGEALGIYRHYNYNLNSKVKNSLTLTTAFGLGYVTEKYHIINNPLNLAQGSNLVASAYLKLNYFKTTLKNKLKFNAGLSLIHFSNISFKSPNLGINSVAINAGFNYEIEPKKIEITKEKNTLRQAEKLNYNLVLRTGFNESKEINTGLYSFYNATFYGLKRINNYSSLTVGVEYLDSKFLKNYIEFSNNEEGTNFDIKKNKRIGVFIGHELSQNNFSFISQIGYYAYAPFTYVSNVYERFGFKYNFGKHIFSEITMKVNLFRAEALEFGLGYRF
jgi:hypothetical protein